MNLPIDIDLLMLVVPRFDFEKGTSQAARSHRQIAEDLMFLADRVGRHLELASGRLTGFDVTMQLTLSCLEAGYYNGTGRNITHSSHKDGEHVGEPRSEFGRLVVAFFALVDSGVSKASLTTTVRKFVNDPERKQAMAKVRDS